MDVSFSLLGLRYSVLHHSIHHRKQVFNYGQLTMIWDDLLFSTFLSS
jgi:sterol desaturase/sphingolipid hydroxylase (fatty acid hydroxylase superfamily)